MIEFLGAVARRFLLKVSPSVLNRCNILRERCRNGKRLGELWPKSCEQLQAEALAQLFARPERMSKKTKKLGRKVLAPEFFAAAKRYRY